MYDNQQPRYKQYNEEPEPQQQQYQRPSYLQTPNMLNKPINNNQQGGYYQQQTQSVNQHPYNQNYYQQEILQPRTNPPQSQQQTYRDQNEQYNYDINNLNNIQPRTRLERGAMKDKEQMEKTRINQRAGFETRNLDVKQLLHNADPTSDLFISENQRFDKDFAIFDKFQREIKLQKREMYQEKQRIEGIERDSYRWLQMERQHMREDNIREKRKEVLLQCKKNSNGLPFNPITLEYERSKEGENLRYRDEQSKVRGYVRAQNLDTRSNCGYNILTGENRIGVDSLVPEQLKDDYNKRIDFKNQLYNFKYRG